MWNPITCDYQCSKACKVDNYLNIKNYSCKKRLIDKLALICEDDISNTIETSPEHKR